MQPNDHPHCEPDGARLPVRGPAALAAALPYLVQLPPQGSIVAASVDEDSGLGVIALRELPTRPVGASLEVLRHWAADVGRIAAEGASGFSLCGNDRLALVLYLPASAGPPPSWFGPAVMAQGLAGAPRLLDVVVVFGGRWRSLVCADEECCPTAGATILDNSEASLIAARLVASGLCVGGDAGVLRSDTRAEDVSAILAAMRYPGSVKSRRSLLRRAWPLVGEPPRMIDEQETALLAMAADRPGVRDALLTRLATAEGGRVFWEAQLDLWLLVTAWVPREWAAGPATMAGIAAWRLDRTAVAFVVIEHALAADPGHRMANLIKQLLDRNAPSADWFERMRRVSESDCLRFDRPAAANRSAPRSQAAG